MFTFSLPRTDSDRLELLNTIFRKSLSTPKEQLAFSPELLVYLRPFISKLSTETEDGLPANLDLVRTVVDELLMDIVTEIQGNCLRLGARRGERVMAEYGISMLVFNPFETEDQDLALAA
jgi:hypothetical protein